MRHRSIDADYQVEARNQRRSVREIRCIIHPVMQLGVMCRRLPVDRLLQADKGYSGHVKQIRNQLEPDAAVAVACIARIACPGEPYFR